MLAAREEEAMSGRDGSDGSPPGGGAPARLTDDADTPAQLRADLRLGREAQWVDYDVERGHASLMAVLGGGIDPAGHVDPPDGSGSTGGTGSGTSTGGPASGAGAAAAHGGVIAATAKWLVGSSVLQGALLGAMAGIVASATIALSPAGSPVEGHASPPFERGDMGEAGPTGDKGDTGDEGEPGLATPDSSGSMARVGPPRTAATGRDRPTERPGAERLEPWLVADAPPQSTSTSTVQSQEDIELTRETNLMDELRRLVAVDPNGALLRVETARASFARPRFSVEREEIAIRALHQLGRTAEAQQRALALEKRSPKVPPQERQRDGSGRNQ